MYLFMDITMYLLCDVKYITMYLLCGQYNVHIFFTFLQLFCVFVLFIFGFDRKFLYISTKLSPNEKSLKLFLVFLHFFQQSNYLLIETHTKALQSVYR